MPLEKIPADLKFQEDENEGMPLLTYTLSAGNGVTTGSSQLLLQNNFTDDTMYLQGFEDGTAGWMLDGLPVLFSSDGQPVFLNQTTTEQSEACDAKENIGVIPNENESDKETQYLENTEPSESYMRDQIYATEGITSMANNMDLITTVLTSNADVNSLEVPSKSYININGLYIPIQSKDTCMEVVSTEETTNDKNKPANEEFYQEITEDVENVDTNLTETNTNLITLSTEISELADVITAYKCKRCEYTCSDKQLFLNHYRDTHLEQSVNGDKIELVLEENEEVHEQPNHYNTIVVSTDQDNANAELIQTPDFDSAPKYLIETNEGTIEINAHDIQQVGFNNIEAYENPSMVSSVDANDETIEEKYILVCSQCSKGFDSIEQCKQHMINDHKLKELSTRTDKSKLTHSHDTSPVSQSSAIKNTVNISSQNETVDNGEMVQNNSVKEEAVENEESVSDTQVSNAQLTTKSTNTY